jgi:nicotinamide-nucleotide amidase
MKAFILPIGDEVLIGQIVDTNSAWIAQQLNQQGIGVRHAMSVGDDAQEIKDALAFALSQADIILVTGGLGPTKDDITKKTMADFFGVGMTFHQETWERIVDFFKKRDREPGEAHYNQCFMPENAIILRNDMGSAPAMWFEHAGKIIVSMPGVPSEMKHLMEVQVLPRLKNIFGGKPIAHRTVMTAGVGETDLAVLVKDFEENLPNFLKLAYLPSFGVVRLRLTGSHDDEAFLNQIIEEKTIEMERLVAKHAYGRDNISLEEVLGNILKAKNKTIATAESCTGGAIAQRITNISGASAYFQGGVVAYDNNVKINNLGVAVDTIIAHGAVSEECIKEMVVGACKTLKTDMAVATSGILGPNGGTPEKPVGLIWIGIGSADNVKTYKININRTRQINNEFATNTALNLARKFAIECL